MLEPMKCCAKRVSLEERRIRHYLPTAMPTVVFAALLVDFEHPFKYVEDFRIRMSVQRDNDSGWEYAFIEAGLIPCLLWGDQKLKLDTKYIEHLIWGWGRHGILIANSPRFLQSWTLSR